MSHTCTSTDSQAWFIKIYIKNNFFICVYYCNHNKRLLLKKMKNIFTSKVNNLICSIIHKKLAAFCREEIWRMSWKIYGKNFISDFFVAFFIYLFLALFFEWNWSLCFFINILKFNSIFLLLKFKSIFKANTKKCAIKMCNRKFSILDSIFFCHIQHDLLIEYKYHVNSIIS